MTIVETVYVSGLWGGFGITLMLLGVLIGYPRTRHALIILLGGKPLRHKTRSNQGRRT